MGCACASRSAATVAGFEQKRFRLWSGTSVRGRSGKHLPAVSEGHFPAIGHFRAVLGAKAFATLLIVEPPGSDCREPSGWLLYNRTGLFTDHMFRILVVLVANVFPNFLTWSEIRHLPYCPRLRKGFRIFIR